VAACLIEYPRGAIWWFAAHGNRHLCADAGKEDYQVGSTRQHAAPAARLRWLAAPALLVAALLVGSHTPAAPQAPAQAPKGQAAAPQKRPAPPLRIRYGTEGLPRPVIELREALLSAVEAGRIDELQHAFEMSEIKPDIGAPPKTDPIAHFKGVSGDGQGREVLAALSLILEAGYVAIPRGADIENNQLYVWPYFAEVPLAQLTPRQEVELMRLVPAGAVREMKAKGKYTHWRLAIGADGTWHAFRKGE
jgi:hypothetical protein